MAEASPNINGTGTIFPGPGHGPGPIPVAHRTRSALEEIPRTITASINPTQNGQGNNTWAATVNLPASYISPTPSPDEMIIRSRGRRSLPLEWSPVPVMESPQKRQDKTPVKRHGKGGIIVLRSSPRKRLQLSEPSPTQQLENKKKLMQMSPVMKKYRSMAVSPRISSPEVAIKGLSQNQLVDVLSKVIDQHPELKEEISEILPPPDLKQMEERLNIHKKSIYKALPTNRLVSKTDSPAFTKASPHISAFKKTIHEQGTLLEEAEQWAALVDYVFLAWSYVRATPVWDSPSHNLSSRKPNFRILTQFCLKGLKGVSWSLEQLEGVLKKLELCRMEHEEMDQCIEYVKTVMSNTTF